MPPDQQRLTGVQIDDQPKGNGNCCCRVFSSEPPCVFDPLVSSGHPHREADTIEPGAPTRSWRSLRISISMRAQIFQRLCELQEADLLNGAGPTAEERRMLDEALAEFRRDGDTGTPWRDVVARLSGAERQ